MKGFYPCLEMPEKARKLNQDKYTTESLLNHEKRWKRQLVQVTTEEFKTLTELSIIPDTFLYLSFGSTANAHLKHGHLYLSC